MNQGSILKTYLRRLTNLTARNRSLVLTTLPQEQFLDLHDLDFLDGKPSFDVIAQLIAQKATVTLCDVLDPRYERVNAASQRLKRIARTEAFLRQERGAEDLHVGYPFVRGQFADGTVVRGPLLFFPVTLDVERNKWVLRRRDEPAFLNRSFLLAYSHFNGAKLPEALLETTFGEANADRDPLAFRTQLYELLKESVLELNFNSELFAPHLLPFERLSRSDLETGEKRGELKLYPQAVLGIFPQAGSYLAPDYEELIAQRQETRDKRQEGEEVLAEEENELSALFRVLSPVSRLLFLKEADILLPFPVDASQEAAIRRVKAGESLVIQGPPGTGKSQVIANLMADFAARGKRVLLVCQKRAALDTVYARLRQVGMGEFAALIHDFQHDRAPLYAQVAGQIDQLDAYRRQNESLDAIFLEREFTQTARRIESLTAQLQEFKDALFDESVCGISPKELYLTSDPDGPRVDLGELYKSFRFGEFDEFLRRLGRVETYETRLADSPWHPERLNFGPFHFGDVPRFQATLRDIPVFVKSLSNQTEALLGQPLSWNEAVGIETTRERWREVLELLETDEVWAISQKILNGDLTTEFSHWLEARIAELDALYGAGLVGASLKSAELSGFRQTSQAALGARRGVVGWWFFGEKDRLRAEAVRYELTLSLPDLERLSQMVETRMGWENGLAEVETRAGIRLLTDDPARTQSQFEAFRHQFAQAQQAFRLMGKPSERLHLVARQAENRSAFRSTAARLLDIVHPIPEKHRAWRAFLSDAQIDAILHDPTRAETLAQRLPRDFDLLHELDGLRAEFSRTEGEVLQRVTTAAVDCSTFNNSTIFQNSLRLAWLDDLETRHPALRSVSGLKMAQWEEELQAAVLRKQALSRDILGLRLREQTYRNLERNRLNNVVTYRDLKHQVTKKRNIWPVRRLLSALSDELFDLVPCWLASPESVSALFPLVNEMNDSPPVGGGGGGTAGGGTRLPESLPPGQRTPPSPTRRPAPYRGGVVFDLVIFDEASQCFAEQGIPALYRGKQAVVAGDRQQLQPSDVYRVRYEKNGPSDEPEPDLEVDSLLDLASRYLPQTRLRGHYRSQSLDLIQFSNERFYGNSLQLLPGFAEINRRQPAIEYRHVAGWWQAQRNETEARAVVDLVRHLSETEPEMSLGIVTFNYPQQQLIQDLLEAPPEAPPAPEGGATLLTRKAPPSGVGGLPPSGAGGASGGAVLFVKNIENVQGDERDIIIFSVGYAPDVRGNVSAQFGSLNQKGGENRLNVAVTRARQRIYVVCSLWPEQLRVDDTLNEGPRVLRDYLAYARRVSEGHFTPQPQPSTGFRADWLLKRKLAETQPDLHPELPFADLTRKKEELYNTLVLTDDDLYFEATPKEAHAYLPITLREKGWPFERVWSREWWKKAYGSDDAEPFKL